MAEDCRGVVQLKDFADHTRNPERRVNAQARQICASGVTGSAEVFTVSGKTPVENLTPGDMVFTMDHGYQPLRWRGRITPHGPAQPIRIRKGALGHDLPATDLVIGAQHGILIQSKIIQRMFDASEVLAPAGRLTGIDGITLETGNSASADWHLLFDEHEIVFAEGAPLESLCLGNGTLDSLPNAARAAILADAPEVCAAARAETILPARPSVPERRARRMALRHAVNQRSLVTEPDLPDLPASTGSGTPADTPTPGKDRMPSAHP